MLLFVAVPPPDPDPGKAEREKSKGKVIWKAFLVSFHLFKEPGHQDLSKEYKGSSQRFLCRKCSFNHNDVSYMS